MEGFCNGLTRSLLLRSVVVAVPVPVAGVVAVVVVEEEVEKADEGTEKDGERGGGGGVDRLEPQDSDLNDFHKLLILRMLRPDRLPTGECVMGISYMISTFL